ncbi:putative fatty-acid amide hydrolase [Talaromyces proteolyticus]|uniref:Fatty-acid amide hydrolase n=1 Tax=Talaromyces proteolyticus TaxID=1131652 RepID=A0AAD4KF95_9EURO|nr:putative fatty-acid amide hydrolase [Talaromyces proteolyticus]KAH8690612.1 putative fatty-acid amide hydrolase [Talaromyces proteolyticus]
MASKIKNYKVIAAAKRAQQQDKIPKSWRIPTDRFRDATNVMDIPLTCGLLDETESRITSDYDATALLEKLRARVWSVEQVTVAFCKRAAIAHQLTNCLTEIFFDDAIERAKKLDLEYDQKSRENALPPLFGLPISLKDSYQVSGYDTSTGLGCYVDQPAEDNSALAAMLIDLGAVLYSKTNLPQSIMTGDSDNNIFGRTLNPRNKLLTVGGSTGGEGALIALRGSILGVGTDIGGSIRVPSVCNGIYGFRPSVDLVPHGGVRDLTPPGTDGIRSTAGPMATSLRDCSLFLKTILQADTWKYDSTSISVPWTNIKPAHKLRIGVAQNDGVYTPSPPVRRALKQAVDLLRDNDDIQIIPINLPDVKSHYQDIISYFTLSGSDQFARTGEPVIPSLEAIGLLSVPGTTLQGFFDLNVRRAEAAKKYLKLFRDNEIDVILMPPAPNTAVPLDCWTRAAYTSLWNYLDYPAIVIPVDHVRDIDSADDLRNAQFGPEDEKLYSLYTGPEQYKDAPICIQVVGYRHKDEALLRAAAVLDSIINSI